MEAINKPKVSVIITAHNYGRFLDKCLDSLTKQTYKDFEIVLVDDGSTDNTQDVIQSYKSKFPNNLKVIRVDNVGLSAACNKGISMSQGDFIIRLDADDYFDDNLLLVEERFLYENKDVDLVYSDYYTIDEDGKILEHNRLMKVNEEVDLLQRSPLAAGAMYKRICYDEIGGYNDNLKIGEDYDFWMKFITKFKVRNINLPLFYYRRHGANMTKNMKGILHSKRIVKEEFVKRHYDGKLKNLKILAVIPARGDMINGIKIPIANLNGKPLLSYTIDEAKKTELFNKIVVSTEDYDIASAAEKLGAYVIKRPIDLAKKTVHVDDVVRHVVDYLKKNDDYVPDLIAVLHLISPFKTSEHIKEGIFTQLIFKTDSIVSVCANLNFHWKPGRYGIEPLFNKRLLRDEKDTILEENGAFYITTLENLNNNGIIGNSVAYVEMMPNEAVRIYNEYDLWLAEQIIKNYKGG